MCARVGACVSVCVCVFVRALSITMRALLLALCLAGASAAKLPSYLGPQCSQSAPPAELSACAEQRAKAGLPYLANGDKKLRVPSMRPLVVPKMSLAQGTPQVGLNVTWEPAEIWGLDESRVFNMRMNYAKRTNEFDVIIPRFTLAGLYKSKGRVLLLPVSGNGKSNVTVTNLKVHYKYEFPSRKGADGKEYFDIVNTDIAITGADHMVVDFENIFNGDPVIGRQINVFLNENWRELIREMGPGMAEATGQVVLLVVKGLANHVPVNEMFAP